MSSRKSRIHKGNPAPKGNIWLEFTVKYRGKSSTVAMPVPADVSDEDIAKFREEFIKTLQNENPTIKASQVRKP